jgi:hypothetical protein
MTLSRLRRTTLLATSGGALLLVALHLPGCSSDDGDAASNVTADAGGTCPAPLLACGASCVDPRNDPQNCGACGKACAAGLACAAGECAAACPSPQVKCDGGGQPRCVSIDTDRSNCGACGKACAPGEVCSNGACSLSCSTNYAACSGEPYVPPPVDAGDTDGGDDASADASTSTPDASTPRVAPYCANLQTDEDNCGVCGKSCDYSTKCSLGLCCPKGKENCNGSCVVKSTDSHNCGGCGIVCPNDKAACVQGSCQDLYVFPGVQNDVPIAQLSGWSICYQDLYSKSADDLAADIQSQCTGGQILVACRQKDSNTLHVAAHAPREDVFFDTGTSNTTHSANGVGWYFNDDYSMGFAGDGDPVDRDECDVAGSPNNTYRLCFHTMHGSSGGYRCGEVEDLNDSDEWERLIFQAK